MGITKEYFCPGHGAFESDKPVCPSGCTVAEREFRTAPAVHSATTRITDSLVRSQVEAFGLSNIRSAREGETSRIETPQMRQQAEFQKAVRSRYPSNWGAVQKGGTMNVSTKEVSGSGPGALGTLAEHHAEAADSTAALRGTKPAYQAVRDPDGMKVDVSKAA